VGAVRHPRAQRASTRRTWSCCFASTSSPTNAAAVVNHTRRFCRHAATQSPVSRCVLRKGWVTNVSGVNSPRVALLLAEVVEKPLIAAGSVAGFRWQGDVNAE
jgi:hypothetical protein